MLGFLPKIIPLGFYILLAKWLGPSSTCKPHLKVAPFSSQGSCVFSHSKGISILYTSALCYWYSGFLLSVA